MTGVQNMKSDKKALAVYAVTDRAWLNGRSLADDVEKAIKGGATMVQLREKALNDEEFLKEAFEIKAVCNRYNVPFIINDNVEVAVKCGADGVHVGQSDLEAGKTRAMVGENVLLGVSAQTVEMAIAAEKAGADYLGVGSVFTTSTKLDADSVSYDTLQAICRAVSIPVVAIGGITKDNLPQLAGSGIVGVAVVSAIFAQEDIESATRELAELTDQYILR